MNPKLFWLFSFVGLYWTYCLYWGFKGAKSSKTSADYFLAGRSIGIWVFVLAATATSFSGWTFIGHPGKIFTDGLPYAFASFYALTIPFTGVLFLRRQWVLGKAYKYITPGEMYSDYYGGDTIRMLTVLVAFLFSFIAGLVYNFESKILMGFTGVYIFTGIIKQFFISDTQKTETITS